MFQDLNYITAFASLWCCGRKSESISSRDCMCVFFSFIGKYLFFHVPYSITNSGLTFEAANKNYNLKEPCSFCFSQHVVVFWTTFKLLLLTSATCVLDEKLEFHINEKPSHECMGGRRLFIMNCQVLSLFTFKMCVDAITSVAGFTEIL